MEPRQAFRSTCLAAVSCCLCFLVVVFMLCLQIFVSYLQVLTLVRKVPLEFPAFLRAAFKTSNQVNPLDKAAPSENPRWCAPL